MSFRKTPLDLVCWGAGCGRDWAGEQAGVWWGDRDEERKDSRNILEVEWQEEGVWREGGYSLSPSWSPGDNVGPTVPEPIEPDPSLTLSEGAALGLLLAGNIGAVMLIGGVGFTIVQSQRYLLSLAPSHQLTPTQPPGHRAPSAARQQPNQQPRPKELWAPSEKVALTPGVPLPLLSAQSGPRGTKRQKGEGSGADLPGFNPSSTTHPQ